MAWLLARLARLGATLESRRVESVEELAGYDVVVNCTGLGARKLWGDEEMYPVRGQVMRVRAPWVRHYVNDGEPGGSWGRGWLLSGFQHTKRAGGALGLLVSSSLRG